MNAAFALLSGALLVSAMGAHAVETVSEISPAGAGVFHHLDASGRNSLAVSGNGVALVWEDNRGGVARCYLAVKAAPEKPFAEFTFGAEECFEPAVTGLDDGRFALIWEAADGVQAALVDADGVGASLKLAAAGGHGNLAFHPAYGLHAAWSAPEGRWRRVWHAPLSIAAGRLQSALPRPADAAMPADDQLFPVLAAGARGLALAWEDRRYGHTVILGSTSADAKNWSPPSRISGNPTGKQAGNLGRGTGAMRPALATFGERIAATWLDKRDFLSGYDVYAALSEDAREGLRFGKDRKAQDSFGDAIAQWHVAIAGNAQGELVIAWDDDRDGTPDIWLTRLQGETYSEDFTLPAISGPGRQSDPAIALDADGNLHLAWIERGEDDATRLRYLMTPLP